MRCWRNKINFIHCNTAIGADGRNKDGQVLDIDELAEIKTEKGKTNIILAHNSFADMHEKVQMRMRDSMRVHGVAAYFCGDRHRREQWNKIQGLLPEVEAYQSWDKCLRVRLALEKKELV